MEAQSLRDRAASEAAQRAAGRAMKEKGLQAKATKGNRRCRTEDSNGYKCRENREREAMDTLEAAAVNTV